MEATLLPKKQIVTRMLLLKGWSLAGDKIRKTVKLADFVHAMGFVNSVALLAEKQNHHPDINIRWNKISLVLSTHSAGGLTKNDFKLAKAIDAL